MTKLKGVISYHTFSEFSGYYVPVEDVINEIAKLPLDGVLGLIATISLEMLELGGKFDLPQFQGRYLQDALIDDFPRAIPGISKMIIPGRVPVTGGRHNILHEQNLIWLCHYALLYSVREVSSFLITYSLRCRILRLLLIINDLLYTNKYDELETLRERKCFSQDWIRHYYFDKFCRNQIEIVYKLARQARLFTEFLPRYFPEFDTYFTNALGISFQRYFEIVILFIGHFYSIMGPGKHWLSKITLSSQVKANQKEIDQLVDRWTRTPEQYDNCWQKWKGEQKDTRLSATYDFVPLRITPIIEARPNELICPIPGLLFAKIEDEPYYILSDYLREELGDKERIRFQKAIGDAYEDYAHALVERIAKADKGGKWQVRRNPRNKENAQLADSYLQKGQVAVIFEHKAMRPGNDFLRGGEGDRVIGPSDNVLNRLDNSENVALKEGRSQDNGLLTRGMWQQTKAGPKIIKWAEKEMGRKLTQIIPIITHLSAFRVDEVVRTAYMDPLINKAKLYKDDFWIAPQWLHITELEAMARMAEDGELDFESILAFKNADYTRLSFDLFIHFYCKGIKFDRELFDSALSVLNGSSVAFFPNINSN